MEEHVGGIMNESIPTELILEIFARIPTKPLFQIRCICKHWDNLINNDPFLPTMHLAQSTSQEEESSLILTHWFHHKQRKSTLKFMTELSHNPIPILDFPNTGRYDLENSCDGLLCFAKCGKEEEAVVSNPLKRGELHTLRRRPPSSAFSRWPHFTRYGLGFDSCNKVYKIVRVFFRDFDWISRRYELGAEVYTIGTEGEWREIVGVPPYPLYRRGVYTNGILHWLVNYEFTHDDDNDDLKSMIVCFDFKKEEFNSIPHPEFSSKNSKWFELVDLRGFLGMVDFSLGTHIEIWKLMIKDYEKKEWVREFKIEIQPWTEGINQYINIEVVGVIGEDDILLKHFDMLVAYNSKNQALRSIRTLSGGLDMDTPEVYVYRGSLVSLSL